MNQKSKRNDEETGFNVGTSGQSATHGEIGWRMLFGEGKKMAGHPKRHLEQSNRFVTWDIIPYLGSRGSVVR